MNPGATTRPCASIVRLAAAPLYLPTPTIFPLWIATSAWNAGSPEPSTTRPFLMSRSYAILFPPPCPAPHMSLEESRSHRGRPFPPGPVVHRHLSSSVRTTAYASQRPTAIFSIMNNVHHPDEGRSSTDRLENGAVA